MPVSAILLAGGRSSRMGRDKATLPLAGRSLLQRALDAVNQVAGLDEIVVVLADGQAEPHMESQLPITVVRDRLNAQGPLAGIATGLEATTSSVSLVLGCDTPFVRPALLRLLLERSQDSTVVLPVHGGRLEPLCSVIRHEALPAIEDLLAAGVRAASAVTDLPGALHLEESEWRRADPEALSFFGVNTLDELEQAEAIARRLDALGDSR